jgi:hypothetical protein
MTIELLLQTICTPYRLPVLGKIMFPGAGMLESVPTDQRHCFQNAVQLRLWTAFRLRDVCSCLSEKFVGHWQDGATFPTALRREFPRLCRHTVCTPANARNRETRVDTARAVLMPDQHTASQ